MVFFEGQEGEFEEFLLAHPDEEIVLPQYFTVTEGRAHALGRLYELRDFGRPVVSIFSGGTTVVTNSKDIRVVLAPDSEPAPEEAQPPTVSPEDPTDS